MKTHGLGESPGVFPGMGPGGKGGFRVWVGGGGGVSFVGVQQEGLPALGQPFGAV